MHSPWSSGQPSPLLAIPVFDGEDEGVPPRLQDLDARLAGALSTVWGLGEVRSGTNGWTRKPTPPVLQGMAPTDPDNGGDDVMWKGTPYAHLIVPMGAMD